MSQDAVITVTDCCEEVKASIHLTIQARNEEEDARTQSVTDRLDGYAVGERRPDPCEIEGR